MATRLHLGGEKRVTEIQGAVLDILGNFGLRDTDGYAHRAAVAYERSLEAGTANQVEALMRVRTRTFVPVRGERRKLTRLLVRYLGRRFNTGME